MPFAPKKSELQCTATQKNTPLATIGKPQNDDASCCRATPNSKMKWKK